MSVDLSSVRGGAVGELTVILTVAVVGKMVGTFVAARLCHLPVRASATVLDVMGPGELDIAVRVR
jgi:hypothetical protein